ncbi:MAG: alpha-N-arabinofuranosidase [Puniceicoccaceae bacterium 5H]|nr:MAG: alpha-N-arabinofuranosidase [Puniceicoccaceae bacterium 5H]
MTSALRLLLILLFPLSLVAEHTLTPLIFQRADPWIHREGDRYYFTGTVPDYDRIELRAADSVAGLACAEPKTVWRRHESGPMSWHIWAPELHRIDGKWYLYFAAGRANAIWDIRMYVLENASDDPMEGEWTERGQIQTRWDSFSLDATTFEHQGTRYLVWAQQEPDSGMNSYIWIAPLKNPWTLAGEQVMISKPDYDWEKQLYKVNEGPAVIKRNGRIFISYSASGTDANYCMGLLAADADADLLDPQSWHKSPEPVFQTSEKNGIYGPGHNGFTTGPDGEDLLVYHARNYRDIHRDPLEDPNRHARVQPFGWNEDGTPEFGEPAPEAEGKVADKPLFRDPIYDGAADPLIIWNPERARWWMFYTNRRAKAEGLTGVTWVHGTRLGIAESCDGGATWSYVGTADIDLPEELGGDDATHWAPEVFTDEDGLHHMLLTVVPGVFEDWHHPRDIVHLTSTDLRHWSHAEALQLASDRVIDACILRMDDGRWRMWYNNERDAKSIYYADSWDLHHWSDHGKTVGDRSGEGPTVFRWHGYYWMITDVWRGLGVYRSSDSENWERMPGDNLLQQPGTGEDDRVKGQHPDVVVEGDRAYIFYFTHAGQEDPDIPDGYQKRRSSIQVSELKFEDGWLTTDRDAPTHIRLDPGLVTP